MANTTSGRVPQNDKSETGPEEQYIVYREPFVDGNGVQQNKEHRVLLRDWPAYQVEHNL